MTKGKTDQYMLLRHCVRGGSWFDAPRACRSAYRFGDFPDYRDVNFGFRVVRVPEPSVNKEQENTDATRRRSRGGSWDFYHGICRSACRDGWDYSARCCGNNGFRVVRVLKPSVKKEQESADGRRKD